MRRLLMYAAGIVATAAIAGIVVYGHMHSSLLNPKKAVPITPADRKPAPTFSGMGLAGQDVSLHAYAGKPVVINFFASWCAPCRAEAPGLARLAHQFGSRVQLIGISIDDKRPGATQFADRFHWTWPIVYEPNDNLAYRYGLYGKPTTIVVDQQGRIAWQHAGKIGTRPIAEVLQDLLRA
ncbi:MAG TPA: TlpA disulfide reductase family protein [Gaiellales bacterium]